MVDSTPHLIYQQQLQHFSLLGFQDTTPVSHLPLWSPLLSVCHLVDFLNAGVPQDSGHLPSLSYLYLYFIQNSTTFQLLTLKPKLLSSVAWITAKVS